MSLFINYARPCVRSLPVARPLPSAARVPPQIFSLPLGCVAPSSLQPRYFSALSVEGKVGSSIWRWVLVGACVGVASGLLFKKKEDEESIARLLEWTSLQKQSRQKRLTNALKQNPALFTPVQLAEMITFLPDACPPELVRLTVIELTKNDNEKLAQVKDLNLNTMVKIAQAACSVLSGELSRSEAFSLRFSMGKLLLKIDETVAKNKLLEAKVIEYARGAKSHVNHLVDILEVAEKLEVVVPGAREAFKKNCEKLVKHNLLLQGCVDLSRLLATCSTSGCESELIVSLQNEKAWLEAQPVGASFFDETALEAISKKITQEILAFCGAKAERLEARRYRDKQKSIELAVVNQMRGAAARDFSSKELAALTAALQNQVRELLKKKIEEDPNWQLNGYLAERLVHNRPLGIFEIAAEECGFGHTMPNIPTKLTLRLVPVVSSKTIGVFFQIDSSIGKAEGFFAPG